METPFAILWFAAKTAVRALGGGVVADLIADVLPAATRDFLKLIGYGPANEDAADLSASVKASLAEPAVRERVRRQLELVVQAPAEELKDTIKKVVKDVGRDQPQEVRQKLAAYLAKVPASVRRALKEAGDATGTTVPPGVMLLKPEDLLTFLPRTAWGRGGDAARQAASAKPPAEAEETRITLTCTAGAHEGRSYTFAGHDTFLVGRSNRAHFQLPPDDRYFSRLHFLIEMNPPDCRLMDMGSRNGTYVNGTRVTSGAELKSGDTIKAGRTILTVAIEQPAETVAHVAAEHEAAEAATLPPTPTHRLPPVGLPRPLVSPRAATRAESQCPTCAAPKSAGAAICAVCQEQAKKQEQPIAGYQIVRELGRGGMGVVHLAVRQEDGSPVALKTIMPAHAGNKSQIERFLREARILQELDHPHIVAFRDLGKSAEFIYFAMDYIRGDDAGKLLKREGTIAIPRAVSWTCHLLQALEYAHAKGFVHRDIKPGNMLIEGGIARRASEGPAIPPAVAGGLTGESVRLADFGLARVYQNSPLSGLTLQGDIAGTYAFMAPEQITAFRESKPSVDLYAAGATLYNLITGKTIFDMPKDAAGRIMMILHEDPVPIRKRRADVPKKLAEVIERTLRKAPEDRYADAKALRRALLEFV